MRKLFINGHIFTSNEAQLYAEAMLVRDGRICSIGDQRQVCAEAGADAMDADEIVDLGGRTVVPGFVDAHMHPMMLAEYSRQIACLPPKVGSIADLVREIARERERLAGPAADGVQKKPADGAPGGTADARLPWIRGWGYDEGKLAEQRSPDRYDLDAGSPDLPVFLVRSCEHIRCVNSKALQIAGISRDTPDPPGGSIDRDEKGEPTGILRENARDLVLPFLPKETEDEMADALAELGQLLLSQGIVAVGDMGNLHPGGNLSLFRKAAEKGFLQRAGLYYMWDYFMDDPAFAIPAELMDPQRRIRIAGLKLIGDGSISGKTAWLREPYPGTDSCGMPVCSDESLETAIAFAKGCGCQISVHAMGGRAIDRVVDRISRKKPWTDGSIPHLRVEHAAEPSEHAMELAAEKGIAFVSQPIFEYCEIETYRANMGEERLRHLYPHRTELEHGIRLALSTDAPATSWAVPSDPFSNLKAAVTRRAFDGTDIGQKERLDIETAIILYTREAARVCGFARLGQLKPGYDADFAVLSEDIFTIDPQRIDRVSVEQTWIRGERVFPYTADDRQNGQ